MTQHTSTDRRALLDAIDTLAKSCRTEATRIREELAPQYTPEQQAFIDEQRAHYADRARLEREMRESVRDISQRLAKLASAGDELLRKMETKPSPSVYRSLKRWSSSLAVNDDVRSELWYVAGILCGDVNPDE